MSYSYVTLSDIGVGSEGIDGEANAMGFIFDDNAEEQTTFDTNLEYGEAFDGLSQLIVEEQLERLDGFGYAGFGATATSLDNDAAQLPAPPEGESWSYKGPNPTGAGHDWESQPAGLVATGQGLFDKLMQNKPLAGLGAAATIGLLWWMFLRKPKGA